MANLRLTDNRWLPGGEEAVSTEMVLVAGPNWPSSP